MSNKKSGRKGGKVYRYMAVMLNRPGKIYAEDYLGTTKKETIRKMLWHESKGKGWAETNPGVFITTFRGKPADKEIIVDAPDFFSAFKGKTIAEVMEFINVAQTYLSRKFSDPLYFVKEYKTKLKSMK